MSFHGTRRDFLRNTGLGAGALALGPVIQQLEARAAGIAPKTPRFVFVVESNGVRPEQMAPSGVERKARRQEAFNGPAEFVDVSLKDRDLPYSLKPITPWKTRSRSYKASLAEWPAVATLTISRPLVRSVLAVVRAASRPWSSAQRSMVRWPNNSAASSRISD